MTHLQLTKNNHFVFGPQGHPFTHRIDKETPWMANYGKSYRPPNDFRRECQTAALEIYHSTQLPLMIGMSGGIDSEVVAESFRSMGLPFKAAVMRFPNNLNRHDIWWAEKYCKKHAIQIEYMDIAPLQFYHSNEFQKISSETLCFFPMLTLQMKLMNWIAERGGFPIIGSGDCYLEFDEKMGWVLFEREIYASLFRFQLLKNFAGVSSFFQWSPELMLSFLMTPEIQKLVATIAPQKNSTATKSAIYQRSFNTELRPKYYGWESFAEEEGRIRTDLKAKWSFAATEIKMPIRSAISQLAHSDLFSPNFF